MIVNGFIRETQHILSSYNSSELIPPEITRITVSYVDDHFMLYRASYEWRLQKADFVTTPNGVSFIRQFEFGNVVASVQDL